MTYLAFFETKLGEIMCEGAAMQINSEVQLVFITKILVKKPFPVKGDICLQISLNF